MIALAWGGQMVGVVVLTLVTVTGELTKTGGAAAHVGVLGGVQELALDMVHPLAAAVSVMTVGSDQVRIIIINSSSSSSSVDRRQASGLHAARMDCTTITISSSSSRTRVCHCHMLEHRCTVLLVVRRPPAWV